ncbi:hypothetical protein LGQ02_02840 [Bacillus shivajii]|uniref:hypothetical protein n=1 Tax=Bacillus shivajii TaxID=1983719 RepID=UPI001CFBA93A|nr:hypothetical protein [Bacillus shivajii]UCZ53741.1 hypothetical protein LGQ02_02840 [Bacillus shivajii]
MKQRRFHFNKKVILTVIITLLMLYVSLALIETKSISFSSVEEAFDNLLVLENIKQDDIVDKTISKNDNYAVILFDAGNRFAFALFEENSFGWRMGSYSTSTGDNSNSISRTSSLITGWIPDEYAFDTEKVLLNDNEAMILELDNNNRSWVFIDTENEIQTDDLNIRFIDIAGNVVNTNDNY